MASVRLSNGGFVLVDDEDVPLICSRSWRRYDNHKGNSSYATCGLHRGTVFMHRMILGLSDPRVQVDHINRDGLDNRRGNLRLADSATNQANTAKRPGTSSHFKGVTWHRRAGKWQAQVKVAGRSLYLGLFESEEGAARAYDEAALEHFGEFACLNFRQVTA